MAKLLVKGSCGHIIATSLVLARKLEVYCLDCNQRVSVIGALLREWYVMCYNCRYRQWSGMSKELAEYTAGVHRRAKNHSVTAFEKVNHNSVRFNKDMVKRGAKVA